MDKLRVADFFCGGGGFSEGFRQAGFDIVFAVDKWLPAVTTYKGNKPGVNVCQGDVITISKLPDDEFEKMVPDSEVIIGSPPCQSFSNSNKSGNNDKTLGIKLVEAYLRIIARKKYKKDSCLKYWVLENVPNVRNYIKEEYSAKDLGLEGDFVLKTQEGASGIYNAKYFGAPTNRERYLCGEFPPLVKTNSDDNLVTLGQVLKKIGKPCSTCKHHIHDVNYPDLSLSRKAVTDHHYVYEAAQHEWEIAKRLKQDRGYMGKMSFPENMKKPSRTVMATMSTSSRESMLLKMDENRYRLPTIREFASMMSFPIDYQFYGESIGIKQMLVGNAVPPKMSYAVAKAIAKAEDVDIPEKYPRIQHADDIEFINLNGQEFMPRVEQPKRDIAKFKYHIPYLIINQFRVELTNYKSDFEHKVFLWNAELHFGQGKNRARVYSPVINHDMFNDDLGQQMDDFVDEWLRNHPYSYNEFQNNYCMTAKQRADAKVDGPFELLQKIRDFIDENINKRGPKKEVIVKVAEGKEKEVSIKIAAGYYMLDQIAKKMGE